MFEVSAPPAEPIPLRPLAVSRGAWTTLLNQAGGDDDSVRVWLLQLGMDRLVGRIEAGLPLNKLPEEDLLHSDNLPPWPGAREKACRFQSAGATGLMCEVSGPKDPLHGRTTRSLCLACQLPDEAIRCSALSHPEGRGDTGGRTRVIYEGYCDAGHRDKVGRTTECRLAGNECWRRDVRVGPPPDRAVPGDASERLVDEFSHLRLALEKLLEHKFARGSGELELAVTLMRDCDEASHFVAHLAALSSLLGLIDGKPKAQELGLAEKVEGGPLNYLQVVLAHHDVNAAGALTTMRAVARLRQMVPVHAKMDSETVAGFRRFGVDVPVTDWGVAWRSVADECRLAFREVRLLVEAESAGGL